MSEKIMTLLTEWSPFAYDTKSIKESREQNGGKLMMKGILQKAETLNQNGRLYPKDHIDAYKYDLHFLQNFKNVFCTLKQSIELCAIKTTDKFGKEYDKWPKLSELHEKLFGVVPNNLHNSFNDILVTLRCFIKLKFNNDLCKTSREFNKLTNGLQIF